MKLAWFEQSVTDYLSSFKYFADQFDYSAGHCTELERLIDDYSAFIIDESNLSNWELLKEQGMGGINDLVDEVRKHSARCVAILEKYRAMKLLQGDAEITNYFRNIEECIEKEFGSFQVTSASSVLLVGSGSFPMTALLIAQRTGAQVVGIDIDNEAIELGLKVTEKLGPGLKITLKNTPVDLLDDMNAITHVIFSSTISNKYEILDQLHPLTNEHVVVAMRYGDQLKSLFNYPMQDTDVSKWRLVGNVLRRNDIFDIALYKKS